MEIYRHPEPFVLESGEVIYNLTIAYHTYGRLNADGSNVAWVCHALTANSDVADWWPGTVEEGGFLDPAKLFVVCANILCSCYGTTGPMSENPRTGRPYYREFPRCTMRDVVRCHRLLAEHLGIGRIHALVGSSVGGFQALEWACMEPRRFDRLLLIATAAQASPWAIAIDETQRMAILADQTYLTDTPDGGAAGLATARAMGLLTYRGPWGYNRTQQDPPETLSRPLADHRACTYQRYQGKKLVDRFDAYSYMAILDCFDTHNVGRDRGGVAAALAQITATTIVVYVTTDIIFTPDEMQAMAAMIPNASVTSIESPFGHDGFLVETAQLNAVLSPFSLT